MDEEEFRSHVRSLSNKQLAKKARTYRDKEEEEIDNIDIVQNRNDQDEEPPPISNPISSMKIGIKPGQSIVTIPTIYGKNLEIPREDGRPWGEEAYDNHGYYGPDWVNAEVDRIKLLENDPNYKFAKLVAGFTKFSVDELIAEEQFADLRQSFFQTQQSSRVSAMTNVQVIQERLEEIKSSQKAATDFLQQVSSKNQRIIDNSEEYEQAVKNLRFFEDFLTIFLDLTTEETTQKVINENPAQLSESIAPFVWKYYLAGGKDNPLRSEFFRNQNFMAGGQFFGLMQSDIADLFNIQNSADTIRFFLSTNTDYQQYMKFVYYCQTEAAPTAAFLLATADLILNNIEIDGVKFVGKKWPELHAEAFVASGLGANLPSDSSKVELIIRRSKVLSSFTVGIQSYIESDKGIYKFGDTRRSILLNINAANATKFGLIHVFMNNYINEYVSSITRRDVNRAVRRTQLITQPFNTPELTGYGIIYDGSSRAINELSTFLNSSFADARLRTQLFTTIIGSSIDASKGSTKEVRILYTKYLDMAASDSLYFILAYNAVLHHYITKEIKEVTEQSDALRTEITNLESYLNDLTTGRGDVVLREVQYPYRQRPSWVMQPRHSGVIQFNPLLVSAIKEAKNQLHQKVDPYIPKEYLKFSQIDFEALQSLDPIDTSLAKLVASNMAFPSIDFPGSTYRYKDSRKQAEINVGEILKELRKYRIKKKFNGKKVLYDVTVEQNKKRDYDSFW